MPPNEPRRTPPAAPTSRIPLPPPRPAPKPMTPERLGRILRRLDAVLVGLAVVFAFLLASFISRNPDFLLHLASGRDLLNGSYHFGTEAPERMTVVSGELSVKPDGSTAWALYPPGTAFEIPARSGFDVRADAPAAYLCEFL